MEHMTIKWVQNAPEGFELNIEYPLDNNPVHDGLNTCLWVKNDEGMVKLIQLTRGVFTGAVLVVKKVEDHPDVVLKEWGPYQDLVMNALVLQSTNRAFKTWLLDMFFSACDQNIPSAIQIHDRVKMFNPFPSELKQGYISITQSRDKFNQDKQTAMTPGRAVKMMFPELDDDKVEQIVDKFRATQVKKDYSLHSGQSKDNFKHAYSHDIEEMQNPYTTSWRKSLANSCMRYSFDQFSHHPAEAYASGDFTIVWVENTEGKIAARSVYGNDKYGPIYGTSEQAINTIEGWMKDNNIEPATNSSPWEGLKLLRHVHREGEYIACYVDVCNDGLEDDGEHLLFTSYGEISTGDHQGLLFSGGNCTCSYCEERMTDDETRYAPDFGDICENCADENFFYCEHECELYHWDYAQRVYNRSRWGVDWVYVHEANVEYYCDAVYVECRDEWWNGDDTYYSEDADQHFTQEEINSGEFVEHNGEWYLEDSETLAELLQEEAA